VRTHGTKKKAVEVLSQETGRGRFAVMKVLAAVERTDVRLESQAELFDSGT
jgi:hypothetical protein